MTTVRPTEMKRAQLSSCWSKMIGKSLSLHSAAFFPRLQGASCLLPSERICLDVSRLRQMEKMNYVWRLHGDKTKTQWDQIITNICPQSPRNQKINSPWQNGRIWGFYSSVFVVQRERAFQERVEIKSHHSTEMYLIWLFGLMFVI